MSTTTTPQPLDVPPGLAGVAVSATEIGDVRGEEGFYHYRQYSAVELANRRSLEDVWFLAVEGRLPDAAEGRAFADRVARARQVPESVLAALPALLRTAPDAPPPRCSRPPSASSVPRPACARCSTATTRNAGRPR